MSKQGNFRYMIVKDLKDIDAKLDHRDISLDSIQNPEHVDGAILARRDVLTANNKDAGTASDATQNKSFIISPNSKNGALLGKYMMHDAGKEMSAYMKEQGIHYIIQESSAKQMGLRKFDTLYNDLDPSHIKYNYSVNQSTDMLKPQSLKKQLLGNLISHLSHKGGPEMQKAVDSIYENVIEPRFRGDAQANKALEKYLKLPAETSDMELRRELDKLDLEKIGIEPLIDALKSLEINCLQGKHMI